MRFIKAINIYAKQGTLKRFKALETNFEVTQGKISALITESELIELQNGKKTMYSRMASTEQTVKGLSQKYTDLNTKYDTVSGQYTDLDSNVADYKTAVDGFSANLTELHTHIEKDYSTTKQMNLAIEAAVNGLTLEVRESSYGNYCTNSNFDSETFGWEYGGNKVPKYTYSNETCTRLLDYVGNSLQGFFETKFIRWRYNVDRKQQNKFVFRLASRDAGTVKVYLDDTVILSVEKIDITEEWKEFSAEATVEQGEHAFKIQVEETNKIVYVTAAQILAKNTDWAESKLAVLSDSISAEVKRASDEEASLSSLITQTAESVNSKVSKGSVISEINQTAEKVQISASKIEFEGLITANETFKIDQDGSMEATAGTIGTWDIDDGSLVSTDETIALYGGRNAYLKIGNAKLASDSHAATVKYGLWIYAGTNQDFTDGTDEIRFYNLRATTGNTLGIASDKHVGTIASSSKRYKDPIGMTSLEDAYKILDIPVVEFKYKEGYLYRNDELYEKVIPGFYAEEIDNILPLAVIHDEQGRAEDWNQRILFPLMVKLLQDMDRRIKELERS